MGQPSFRGDYFRRKRLTPQREKKKALSPLPSQHEATGNAYEKREAITRKPHLRITTSRVITSLSAIWGCGSRARKRRPWVTIGNVSSIKQKQMMIKSSKFMKILPRDGVEITLRIFREPYQAR